METAAVEAEAAAEAESEEEEEEEEEVGAVVADAAAEEGNEEVEVDAEAAEGELGEDESEGEAGFSAILGAAVFLMCFTHLSHTLWGVVSEEACPCASDPSFMRILEHGSHTNAPQYRQ